MFYSILFCNKEQYESKRETTEPECFKDLNLRQVFSPVLKEKKKFRLEEFFYTMLHEKSTIEYRQNIMRELENDELCTVFDEFSKTVYDIGCGMENTREILSSRDDFHNNYVTRGYMLDYADEYCKTVSSLFETLANKNLVSKGLSDFYEYIKEYICSSEFQNLSDRVKKLREEFATVHYCMLIDDGIVKVRKYEGQENHSKQIMNVFDKFKQGDAENYLQKFKEEAMSENIEAAVLKMVSNLYKDIFEDLNGFCRDYIDFEDETIIRFSREIQFYISWLDCVLPLKNDGLSFNYPIICETPDHLYDTDGFDIALAKRLRDKIVTNDFRLDTPERIIAVTGPNQGGKTTYARAFGQIHFLASLGCCVPGQEAALYMADNIFTHFGREEDVKTFNGKLRDDLVRLKAILSAATEKSIIIINEIFSSTTLSDAVLLGRYMMDSIVSLGAPAVIVTFLDEIASYGAQTVSMMSTVKENDPSERTFKIIRKPPNGLAYAIYIAEKHGLTYEQLSRRIKNGSTPDV